METTKKNLNNGVLNMHLRDAAGQLTCSEKFKPLTQLTVPEAKKKSFQTSRAPHAMCGCFSCMELAKTFVLDDEELKQDVEDASAKYVDNDQ